MHKCGQQVLNLIWQQFDLVSLLRPLIYIANPPFSMDTGVGLAQVMVTQTSGLLLCRAVSCSAVMKRKWED